MADSALGEQAYRISARPGKVIEIAGGDNTGLMYGGLELAELITIEGRIPRLREPVTGVPYISQRGLKFNVPLDIRTPSYQDAGDAAQKNIAEMWNMDFWKAYLDMMARNRYNVLTLWNPHPFPSMVRLDKYPGVSLEDVCGTSFPLDTDRPDEPVARFIAGCGISKEVTDNLVVLKKMTIDEKIQFWQDVMKYARERGVEVYFITWNIWMNSLAPPGWYREQENKKGSEGKYGINNDQENPNTIAYLREAVRQFIITYPDLAGIGITAGENMEDRNDEYDREKWLWRTYGEGILDAKKIQPDREVKFIHRHWQSGVDKMVNDFISKYPDQLDLSFKYARARMYATPAPRWADEYISEIREYGLKSWWNVRNDDIFHFRWGDAEYASEFIKNIPPAEVTAGYYMGSDGYVWGREFISRNPSEPRELEIDKHWYNFMLWGRMGYDPDLSADRLRGLLKLKYPGADIEGLYKSWSTASRIPSMVTRFHWHDWDFMWAVEGCLDLRKGFHTVEDFIKKPPMEGSGVLGVIEYVEKIKNGTEVTGITPLQVASSLDSLATEVLAFLESEWPREGEISDSYDELLYDLKSWAFMGKYYSGKIVGACYLHEYRQGINPEGRDLAIEALQGALRMWEEYAGAASRNYMPQFLAKTRTIDWIALTEEVRNDLAIAENEAKK
ncbi:MAG: hypothetical protein IH592_10275 [Bacteroidales bacterium]|nr:hypothetical protein [Bacteroidales bacterium]